MFIGNIQAIYSPIMCKEQDALLPMPHASRQGKLHKCQKQIIPFHAVEARVEEPEPARLLVAWRGQQLQGAHGCSVTGSLGRLAGHG